MILADSGESKLAEVVDPSGSIKWIQAVDVDTGESYWWILMVDPVGGSWWWIPWIKVLHNGRPQQHIKVY